MLNRLFGMFALLLMAFPAVAQAQSLKVGYTDHEVIIMNLPKYAEVQKQLQQEYQAGQEELQTLAANYQKEVEQYQKQAAVMTAEKKQEREQELMQLQQSLQQQAQTKEQGLGQREAELLQPIYAAVDSAIQQVAKEKGLDLVLRAQVGVQPLILYVNEQTITNITEDVARKLGVDVDAAAQAPATPAAAPAASNQ